MIPMMQIIQDQSLYSSPDGSLIYFFSFFAVKPKKEPILLIST
jgi:hypothetical protein